MVHYGEERNAGYEITKIGRYFNAVHEERCNSISFKVLLKYAMLKGHHSLQILAYQDIGTNNEEYATYDIKCNPQSLTNQRLYFFSTNSASIIPSSGTDDDPL